MSPDPKDTAASDDALPETPATDENPDADAPLQGEGNYTAARRHRKSLEKFVDSGQVEQAAREAAPDSPQQAEELDAAEQEGRAHARD